MAFKEELIGFCTLAVMGLLGMALYSGTYSLIYASIGINEPTVAILEMWMSSVHLFCAVGCCVLQGLYAGLFKQSQSLAHLAEAQTALFLGIAIAVTILGNGCLQSGDCLAYYGAASFPRLAAAGSIAWGWVMYASSLGCQAWEKGLSLGFNGEEGLTAASVLLMLPGTVNGKLRAICGWEEKSGDEILPLVFVFGGLVVYHLGNSLFGKQHFWLAFGVRMGGLLLFLGAFVFMPTELWSSAYNYVALALSLNPLLGEFWKEKPLRKPNNSNNTNNNNKPFSLSGLTHKLKTTFSGARRPAKHANSKA
jgi:hypothetical protein